METRVCKKQRRFSRLAGAAMALALVPAMAAAAPPPHQPRLVAKKPIAAPAAAVTVCARYDWACARGGGRDLSDTEILSLAKAINAQVNRRVRALSDLRQYGIEDVWALPTARGGDCEDFALEKKRRLIEAGLSASTLLIATALDPKRNGHAVLVLRTAAGDYVLDNLRAPVLLWHDTGYSYLLMQNAEAPNRWDAIFEGGIFAAGGT